MPPIIKAWGEKIVGLSRPFFTWGSCRSPPRRRLRLFWKKEWISAFSMEVVMSMESSERAFSSQRVREKVNATTGVCCRWDRKCRRVSHTARSWWGKKMGGRGMRTGSNRMLRRQKRKEGNYLTSWGVVRSIFRAKRLGVFAGALLLGIDSCIVPEQQPQLPLWETASISFSVTKITTIYRSVPHSCRRDKSCTL